MSGVHTADLYLDVHASRVSEVWNYDPTGDFRQSNRVFKYDFYVVNKQCHK